MQSLSPREVEVESLALKGLSGLQIGALLSIKLSTVKMHLASVYKKRGVKNKLELLASQTAVAPQFALPLSLPIGAQNG